MKTDKFIAPTINEALNQVKEKLGRNALIISNKKIQQKSGRFGMFGREMVEVIACSDNNFDFDKYDNNNQKKIHHQGINKTEIGSLPINENSNSNQIYEVKDILTELNDRIEDGYNHGGEIQYMRQEITELKGVIKSLVDQKPQFYDKNWHENLLSLFQKLTINGLEEKFSNKIIEEIINKVNKSNFEDYEYLKLYTAKIFIQSTAITNLLDNPSGIVSLMGTTGVGKTTSLAKIIAKIKMDDNSKKIALITLDNYRIGAVEQLKEYARIIRAPCKALNHPSQLKTAIKQFKNYDWIFIDTPGSSQRDTSRIDQLDKAFNSLKNLTTLLVLDATKRDFEVNDITSRFKKFNISGTVFTKLDEASTYGLILNHMIRHKLPLYFLTTGQNVPDDLETASYERVIDLVLNMADLDSKVNLINSKIN